MYKRLLGVARLTSKRSFIKKSINLIIASTLAFSGGAVAFPSLFSGSVAAIGSGLYVDPNGVDTGNCQDSLNPCQTIDYAVSQADPSGDTINLAAGNYDEGSTSLSLTTSLDFVGPNSIVSPNGGTRSAEAIITGDAGSGAATFNITSGSATVTFKGLEFQGAGEPVRSDTPGSTIDFEKNIFTGNMTDNMYFQDPTLTVNDNLFENMDTPNADTLQVGGNYPTSANTITITHNTWKNITEGGALNLSAVTGTISDNTFDSVPYYAILVADTSGDLNITNNTFNNITNPAPSTSATWGAGIRLADFSGDPQDTISVTSNTFRNSYLGISVRPGTDLSNASYDITGNTFNNNQTAALNDGLGSLDLSGNWWSNVLGPNSSDNNGAIDINNWCSDSSCASTTSASGGNISLPSGPIATPTVSGGTSSISLPDSNDVTSSSSTSAGTLQVSIPAGTNVTASSTTWDGAISAPAVVNYSVPGGSTSLAISVGDTNDGSSLTFDQPVKLVLPGQAGKLVGFVKNGSFTQITQSCIGTPTISQLQTLDPVGACYVTSGSDLIVWTDHFTTFATYTANAGTGGGSSSTSSSSATKTSVSQDSTAATTPTEEPAAASVATPTIASTSQPKLAAKEAGGIRWYWWIIIAAIALAIAGAGAYRYADGTEK